MKRGAWYKFCEGTALLRPLLGVGTHRVAAGGGIEEIAAVHGCLRVGVKVKDVVSFLGLLSRRVHYCITCHCPEII